MKLLKKFLKNFILRSDMFAAQPTLRFNGQSSYETNFGGCLSILLVLSFAIIFSNSFINVLNKVNVSATTSIEDNPYDQTEIDDIRLAVGIKGLDFSLPQRYFNLILVLKQLPLGGAPIIKIIQLNPCQKEDWQNLGQKFDKLFDVYSMEKMLCPSPSQNLYLKGFAGSQSWISMSLLVEQCHNNSAVNWTCYSPLEIQNKIATQLTMNDFFKVDLLIANTIINPQKQDPLKIVLQNQIFITFSNTSGSRCQVKLGRYEISTDNSIWPFSTQSSIKGHYITNHQSYTINLYSTHYVHVELQKSRTIFSVSRSHDKLDEMLSYVGGLFSLLFGWLFFFIGSYNQYKYQISVGQHTFAIEESGKKLRQEDFGFLTYLRYALYDWIKTFNIPIVWPKMQQIDRAREQANEQMDIKYLMKRLQQIQKINKILLGQHNLICSNLTRPPTLSQAKRIRKITQYYDKVIKMQNQQNLILNIFKLGNSFSDNKNQVLNSFILSKEQQLKNDEKIDLNNKLQKEKLNENELDSQDQEIETSILQIYKEQNEKNRFGADELTLKIFNQIPQSIRDRFTQLQNSSKQILQKKREEVSKIKVQSAYDLNEGTPHFLSILARKQAT